VRRPENRAVNADGDRERASVSEARKTALAIAALGTLYLGSLQDMAAQDPI
jgi:hypothetical protein